MSKYGVYTGNQIEAVLNIIGGEATINKLLRGELKINFEAGLVHGLFVSVESQIARWREWLPKLQKEHKFEVDLDAFLAANPAPEWPENRLTAVVLALRAPTAVQEFQLYWPLIAAPQKSHWKWDELKFDVDHIRWLEGSGNVAADWHFEWQVIDLGANRKTPSKTVRKANPGQRQAGVEVLAAAALHDEWVRRQNGDDVPFVDLPAYEVSVDGYAAWQCVPRLGFDRDGSQVRLLAGHCGNAFPGWGVPSLLGNK